MRWRNTETPVYKDTSGTEAAIVEDMDLVDRLGNIIAKFKKTVSGAIEFTVNGQEVGGGSVPYLVYRALLTQSGTDAPVAVVLENTLGGEVVWTREDVGIYSGTLSGVFLANETFIPTAYAAPANANRIFVSRGGDNFISIEVFNGDGDSADQWVGNFSLEILVYQD